MNRRIDLIDALRGFSLAGIVIVHFNEQFIGGLTPPEVMDYAYQGIGNGIIGTINFLFLRGKFFALFSFLFGLSFFIQMENAKKKGLNYELKFLWRLVLLLAIGCAHHLFYRGDILTIYAILGVFLLPIFEWKTRRSFYAFSYCFLGCSG